MTVTEDFLTASLHHGNLQADTDAAAFAAHLRTDHVHTFISAIPDLSSGGPGSLVQLNEIPRPRGIGHMEHTRVYADRTEFNGLIHGRPREPGPVGDADGPELCPFPSPGAHR